MGWLRRGVDDRSRAEIINELQNADSIANVQFVMMKSVYCRFESFLIPSRIPVGTEEDRALIVVDAVNRVSLVCEVDADLRPNETRRSSHEKRA